MTFRRSPTQARESADPDRRRNRRSFLVDAGLFFGSAALGVATQSYLLTDHSQLLDLVDIAAGSLACLALWLRRSRPMEVFVVAFLAASFSPLALFAGFVALFNAAARLRGTRLAVCAALALAGSVAFPIVNPKAGEALHPALPVFLASIVIFGAALLARTRRELVASLEERAERLESDKERHVIEAQESERRRIAREMHDVLAHRLSLLSIHAGALEFHPDASPEEIARAAAVIRASAAGALEELRQVITILREDTAHDGTGAPQPTLNDLPALLDESRTAGMHLEARLDLLGCLPEALGRTGYRVVQEGLTNARKHAPGAPVDLAVSGFAGGGLVVEVISRRVRDLAPADCQRDGTRAGLIGLAERVTLAGGTLEHGFNAAGDFVLRATVPGS